MRGCEINTALVISGRGSTAAALIQEYRSNTLQGVVPMLVVATNTTAGKEVKAIGIEPVVVRRARGEKPEEQFGDELNRVLREYEITMVALLGCLAKMPENTLCFAREYDIPMWNMHPGATDPGRADFGGMHGGAALAACLLYYSYIHEEPVGTSTTHFVSADYDAGDIIRTQEAQLEPITDAMIGDHAMVIDHVRRMQNSFLAVEHKNVIETAHMFASDTVRGWKRDAPLIRTENVPMLVRAKELAVQLFPKG